MAKLLEQRRMIKSLHTFYKKTGYSSPATEQARLGHIAQDAIPEKDFSDFYFHKVMNIQDRFIAIFRKKYTESPSYIFDRANKNNRLYKSCLDDGFIEPVEKEEEIKSLDLYSPNGVLTKKTKIRLGIRPSTKGTDLLHFWGFIEASFNKYPTGKLIIYTVIGTLLSTAVLGAFITKYIIP